MPWYFPWSDSIKKRACRYLLQHYLGHFLKEKLTLDQLSLDLYNGTGTIQDVLLDVASVNEALDTYSIPVEIVDGFIGSMSFSIPWSDLVQENTQVEICNLEITIQPRQRKDSPANMLDSMFSSMTTSLQLAQECLKQDTTEGEQQAATAQPFEGLEMFAQTIEAVLSKIRVSFRDTIIRLEHLPRDAQTGAAVEIRIARIEYHDDQAVCPGTEKTANHPSGVTDKSQSVYQPAAVAHKNFQMMGVTIFCDEFPAAQRTMSKSATITGSTSSPRAGSGLSTDSLSPPLSPPLPSGDLPHSPQGSTSDTSLPREQDPIKVAVLCGRQEIKLKVKQTDELPGPKLEMEGHLGGVNLHFSPRQVHLLIEIAQGLASPGLCDDSNVRGHATSSKPMMAEDYARVEQELQRQLHTSRLGEPSRHKSPTPAFLHSQRLDDSDDESEVYFDLGTGHSEEVAMDGSITSTRSTSTTTSLGGSSSTGYTVGYRKSSGSSDYSAVTHQPRSSHQKTRSRQHKGDTLHRLMEDPAADTTCYKLKVSCLAVLVLHEDPAHTPGDAIEPGFSSADKLTQMADKFFGRVQGINTSGAVDSLPELRTKYAEACPFDHISVICKPVTVECQQKSAAANQTTSLEIKVGSMEVAEALYERRAATFLSLGRHFPQEMQPEFSELLHFPSEEVSSSGLYPVAKPCLRIHLQSASNASRQSRLHTTLPAPVLHLEFGRCRSEIDITIVDRINALLNPQPLAAGVPTTTTNQGMQQTLYESAQAQSFFTQTLDETSTSDKKLRLQISSSHFTCALRFPVLDLRHGPGLEKPWWCRRLHPQKLLLELTDTMLMTVIDSEPLKKYELTCKHVHGLFQECANSNPVSFLHVSDGDNTAREQQQGFDRPRLVIKCYPQTHSLLEPPQLEDTYDYNQDSLNGACQFSASKPSPFSSKKVVYESEEMVMPAERAEMNEFMDHSTSHTLMTYDINLPQVTAHFPNKKFFELLYNRIVDDLLLWESQAPAPVHLQDPYSMPPGTSMGLDLAIRMQLASNMGNFSMCKSGVGYDSSSDSEESLGQFSNGGQSFSQHSRKRRNQHDGSKRQSKLCVSLGISRGRITGWSSTKHEDPMVEQPGAFGIDIEDGSLFTVVGYDSNPELTYLCFQAHKATLYHNGQMTSTDWEWNKLGVPLTGLYPTIYLSEPGVITTLSGQVGQGGDSKDMFVLAMSIRADRERRKKDYQVAISINGATLRHRPQPTGQSWFSQVLAFFNVLDYPILGYVEPNILTELHLHLHSCAIDYRPVNLPLRALLTAVSFSMSSNIVAESSASLLRFLIDECALYISDRCDHQYKSVDLRKNYVCVIDMGMFELSLRSTDGNDLKYPRTDLRASSNILHVRTCYDSCHALATLINYLASDGDLDGQDDACSTSSDTSTKTSQLGDVSSQHSTSPQMTRSHLDQVDDMMAEAMQESDDTDSQSENSPGKEFAPGTELYFFPDEGKQQATAVPPEDTLYVADSEPDTDSNALSTSSISENLEMAVAGCASMQIEDGDPDLLASGSSMSEDTERFSDDEEFCVINDPGMGISPRDGAPVIKVLTKEPIVMHDDHFKLPIGKADQLRPPEDFPPAVYRYTLREMSLVWHMYGGRDFTSSPHSRSEKLGAHIAKMGARRGHSKGSAHELGQVGWRARGGVNRDVDILMELQLNKVRMQYDIYPENTLQASRQILLINEVELRDRLSSSRINKFLYRYTSQALPRQAHANMVLIKALHVRPDLTLPTQECSLKVSLQPLRLNIDQDALFFLRTFFSEISGEDDMAEPAQRTSPQRRIDPAAAATTAMPVRQVAATKDQPEDLVLFDEIDGDKEEDQAGDETIAEPQLIFYKSFLFSPDVPIKLDYHGKRLDMEQGTVAGLLAGLAQLNCSQLRIKRLHHRHGLLGSQRLVNYALREWLQDIKKNQIPSILGGVGPMYSLVQLVQGVRDLFWLPVEQYRKDGRIVRGLQRGAKAFLTSTAMSTLELTNRLVQTVQGAAEVAYDMVSPGPGCKHRKWQKRQRRIIYPADFREGISNAYAIVREGIQGTAENIVNVVSNEHSQKGVAGAMGGVLRQLPPTALEPVIIASEATSNVLGGMRNQLLPDRHREDQQKWKVEEEETDLDSLQGPPQRH